MQVYSHFQSLAQALNATNYPANCEYHVVPPSIHPTELGGIGDYFAVARAEIPSATYSTDNMVSAMQTTVDPVTNLPNMGIDIYRDTANGIQFVGSVTTHVGIFVGGGEAGGNYGFIGNYLGIMGAIDPSSGTTKMLIIDCTTLTLNYYATPNGYSGYGVIATKSIWIAGVPYLAISRAGSNSQTFSTDFYRCTDGQFFSGVSTTAASVCYGEYIISHFSGALYVAKMRTASYPSYPYPVVEEDPAFTTTVAATSGSMYGGFLLAPLDGGYTFSDARESKTFTLDPVTTQVTWGTAVNNYTFDSHWGKSYFTGPNHQYPNHILQNGCLSNTYGPKSGFLLFNITDPTPSVNQDGSWVLTSPYFGRQCATHLMASSSPATPANLTTIPVKYSGLVSLHRGLIRWNHQTNKVEQFGITDWQRPTTWAEAMASSHCPWFFDAAAPVSQSRQDTLFTLDYRVPAPGSAAWVLKNRHPIGLHAPHAVDVAPGTKLRVYALVESDTDLNHGYFAAHDFRLTGTLRNTYDERAAGLYENDYASGIVFCGQRAGGGGLNTVGIVGALAVDAVNYLQSAYADLSPVGVTLQAFLDELNTSAIVESESAFFSDWQNRAAKSYVDLTFTVNTTLGRVFVLIEVYKAGILVTSANFNSGTSWQYYNTDSSGNSENTLILSIGSACTNQPLIVEPLVTPKPFALRM